MNWTEDFVLAFAVKRPALPRILKWAENQRDASVSPEMARASAGPSEEKGAALYSNILTHVTHAVGEPHNGEGEPGERVGRRGARSRRITIQRRRSRKSGTPGA